MIVVKARFLSQPMTGTQRYGAELSLRLKQIDPSIHFVCPKNVIQHELFEKLQAEVVGHKTGLLWEQIDLPKYLKAHNNPLLVNYVASAPFGYGNRIVTLHDITYLRYPKSYSLKFRLQCRLLTPLILKNSLALITVSEFSKKEISGHFRNYPPPSIHVIYNATGSQFTVKSPNKPSIPYLLAVSSHFYHKNIARLIEAFVDLHKSGKIDIPLVIAGGSSPYSGNQNFNTVSDSSIRFMGRVSDEELISLYQSATAFIFPSLYEGFGIPPLEAQACGCPVIASNAAAIPEVLGDSVLYFNPDSVSEMQDAIYSIVTDASLRQSLREKGLENVKRFSWDDSASRLYDLILKYS
ncbi:MAG: glycosyltransferase family 4 protein [Tannerellaceae bacterium]|jgi:glycosyltransferase involved in cell wall biosynthesis|nr:glycosyltransferase family 4 protein [Tannerellaceae bacterium]